MKRRTQILLIGAMLVAAAMLSLARRGAQAEKPDRAPCCPSLPGLDAMPMSCTTNATTMDLPPAKKSR